MWRGKGREGALLLGSGGPFGLMDWWSPLEMMVIMQCSGERDEQNTIVAWVISLAGTVLWVYGYFATGNPSFIDWHTYTPGGFRFFAKRPIGSRDCARWAGRVLFFGRPVGGRFWRSAHTFRAYTSTKRVCLSNLKATKTQVQSDQDIL